MLRLLAILSCVPGTQNLVAAAKVEIQGRKTDGGALVNLNFLLALNIFYLQSFVTTFGSFQSDASEDDNIRGSIFGCNRWHSSVAMVEHSEVHTWCHECGGGVCIAVCQKSSCSRRGDFFGNHLSAMNGRRPG